MNIEMSGIGIIVLVFALGASFYVLYNLWKLTN